MSEQFISNSVKAELCYEHNKENMEKINKSIKYFHKVKDANNTIFCYRNKVSEEKKKEHEELLKLNIADKVRGIDVSSKMTKRQYMKANYMSKVDFAKELEMSVYQITKLIDRFNIPVVAYNGKKHVSLNYIDKIMSNNKEEIELIRNNKL